MKANAFKHKILFYQRLTSKNEFEEQDFTQDLLVKEVYASCKNLNTQNKELNDGLSHIATHEFELRFLELDFSYYLVFRGEKYEILSLCDETQEQRFLKIQARIIQ